MIHPDAAKRQNFFMRFFDRDVAIRHPRRDDLAFPT